MEKLNLENTLISPQINRRDFLKVSGSAASIAGGVILTNLSMATPLSSINLHSGQVANVWVNNQGANNWDTYYGKFLRLMDPQNHSLNTQWMSQDKTYLLKITMDDKRGYPYSTDPKLVYSMVCYLVNEKHISEKNIFITDQSLTRKPSDLNQQIAQLRSSGIYSGLRRALPLKKVRTLTSKNKMPLKWLGDNSELDHVIELASLSSFHNGQRINDINTLSSHAMVPSYNFPKLTISSATKVCCEIEGKDKIIKQQPGMILASNNPISHGLLANAYLNFCSTQKTITTEDGYIVANENKHSVGLNPVQEATFKAMKSYGYLAEVHWYSDNQDAPQGVVNKVSSDYFPSIKVNNYSFV